MEIYLDKRAIRQIRTTAQDAIDEGDTEAAREEILESFTEEQIDEIERRLDHGDLFEFLTDILEEWGGEDVDELFEILETHLTESGWELKLDDDEESDDDEAEDEDDNDDSDEKVDFDNE